MPLFMPSDRYDAFQADTASSQAEGDYQDHLAGLQAVKEAHDSYFRQAGAIMSGQPADDADMTAGSGAVPSPSPASQPATLTPSTPAVSPAAPDGGYQAPTNPVSAAVNNQTDLPASIPSTDYVGQARAAAQRHNVDPDVFQRQIQQESSFNPTAVSPAGARGIAQFMPETARGMGVNPDDPAQALEGAATLMRNHLDRYGGDYSKALAAYNAGPGNVDRYGGVPPFEETQRYVKTIMGGGPPVAASPAAAAPPSTSTDATVTRPSQFGVGLSYSDALAACGPVAALALVNKYGSGNIPAQAVVDAARSSGLWDAQNGMHGISAEQQLLQQQGVATKLETNVDWNHVRSDVANGNPVIISTPGHYFVVDGVDPETGTFHVGTSGTDLKAGTEYMTPQRMQQLEGAASGALYVDNPQAHGPSVAEHPDNLVDQANQAFHSAVGAAGSAAGQAKDTAASVLQQAEDQFQKQVSGLPGMGPSKLPEGTTDTEGRFTPDYGAENEQRVEQAAGAGAQAVGKYEEDYGNTLDQMGSGYGKLATGQPRTPEEQAAMKQGPYIFGGAEMGGGELAKGTEDAATHAANIQLDRFPEDVQPVIKAAADANPEGLDAARRGVLPDDVVKDLSQQTNINVGQLVQKWQPGQAFNAETLVAVRDALSEQANRVLDAQQSLRAAPDSVDAQTQMLNALSMHGQLQEVVTGATAEAGRALRAVGTDVTGGPVAVQRLKDWANAAGLSTDQVMEYLKTADLSDPRTVAQLAQAAQKAPQIGDYFRAYYVGNLVSSIPTLAKVATNAIINPAWQLGRHLIFDPVAHSEALGPTVTGYFRGLADAGGAALNVIANGVSSDAAAGLGGRGYQSVAAQVQNPIGKALLTAAEMAPRLHAAAQEFTAVTVQRMEMGRQAAIQAASEGLHGDQWAQRVDQLLANPPPEMVQSAGDVAQRAALRGDLGTTGSAAQKISQIPFFGTVVLPVVKIAANTLTGAVERSPLGLAGTAFDVARQARGVGPYAGEVSKAVTPVAERLQNNLMGTALTAWLMSKAMDGKITGDGPSDLAQRQELMQRGWAPNSVYVPGAGFRDYHALGVLAGPLAVAGNAADAMRYDKPQDTTALVANTANRMAAFLADDSALHSIGQFYNLVSGRDPGGREGAAANTTASIAQGLTPAGAAVRSVALATDPTARAAQKGDVVERSKEQVELGIPGLRQQVPPSRDLTGAPAPNPQSGAGILLPRGANTALPVPPQHAGEPAKYIGVKDPAMQAVIDGAVKRVNAWERDPTVAPRPSATDRQLENRYGGNTNPAWQAWRQKQAVGRQSDATRVLQYAPTPR